MWRSVGVGSPHSPRLRAGQLSDCNLSKQAGLYRTFLPNHKSPQAQGRPGWGFLAMATVWCKGGMCICAKWSGWRSLSKQSQSRGTVGQEEWQEQWAGARALLSLCPESSGQSLSLAVTDEATGSVLCRFPSQGPPRPDLAGEVGPRGPVCRTLPGPLLLSSSAWAPASGNRSQGLTCSSCVSGSPARALRLHLLPSMGWSPGRSLLTSL